MQDGQWVELSFTVGDNLIDIPKTQSEGEEVGWTKSNEEVTRFSASL